MHPDHIRSEDPGKKQHIHSNRYRRSLEIHRAAHHRHSRLLPGRAACMLPADSAAGTNINITRTFFIGSPSWKTSSGAGKARNSPRTSPPGVGLPGGPVRSGLRRSYGSIKSCINPTDSQDSIEVAANLAKTTRLNWGSSTYRPENAGCRSLVATLSARSLKVASVLTLDCSSTDSETDADYLGCLVPGAAMMDPG